MTRQHAIAFKTTVEPVTELLFDQLDGALQIIAALILTDEEGLSISEPGSDCRPDPAWIRSMRKALLSEEWRPDLIQALKKQGFRTNTHPGFPLGRLLGAPRNPWKIDESYRALEVMLREYAEGKGDEVPEDDDYKSYWTHRLIVAGHDPEIASWVLDCEGGALACEAALERLMLPHRNKETQP